MSEELQTLKNIEFKIAELLKWSKFAGLQQLKNVLAQALGSDETAALVFELSDGTRSTREVGRLARTSNKTVARYWKKWSKLGIVEPSSTYQGRCQRICSLEEVGLPVPQSQQSLSTSESEDSSENEENE